MPLHKCPMHGAGLAVSTDFFNPDVTDGDPAGNANRALLQNSLKSVSRFNRAFDSISILIYFLN